MTRIINAFILDPAQIQETEKDQTLKTHYDKVIHILNNKTLTESNKKFLEDILKKISKEQRKTWHVTPKNKVGRDGAKIMDILKNILNKEEMQLFNRLIGTSTNERNIPNMVDTRKKILQLLKHFDPSTSPKTVLPEVLPEGVFKLFETINKVKKRGDIFKFMTRKILGQNKPPGTPI